MTNPGRAYAGPRRRRRVVRIVVGVLLAAVVVLVGLLVWVGVDALRARASLSQAADRIASISDDALAGRTDGLESDLEALRRDTGAAQDATSGAHWTVAVRLPVVGPTVDAVATLAGVGDDLARGPLTDLVNVTEAASPAALAPVEGRVELAPLQEAAPTVVAADEAVTAALERVDAIRDTLVPQVDDAVVQVRDRLTTIRATTATASRAVRLIPPMLGAHEVRRYLVLVQTNSEPRALGGIPGSLIQLRADDGEVVIEDQRETAEVGMFDAPVLPLDASESALFGDKLARFAANVTMTPDFPRAAQLAREMWRRHTGVAVDGVLAIDPVALAGVLRPQGPLELLDGTRLQGDDVARYLLHDVYLENSKDMQDRIFTDAASSAFELVMQSKGADSPEVVAALAQSARDGRLLVWSSRPDEQSLLDGTVLDGALRGQQGERTPVVGVYTTMTRAGKMGWFLDSEIDVGTPVRRADGTHEVEVTVTYANRLGRGVARDLPRYVAGIDEDEPGMLRINVLVYAPAGGQLRSAHSATGNVALFPQIHQGLVVGARTLYLSTGETNSVTYVMITGKQQPGDVVIRSTPGPRPTVVTYAGEHDGRRG